MKVFGSVIFLAVGLVGPLLAFTDLQEAGIKPKSYTLFDLPWEAIPILEKHLPEDPVIVEAGAFDGRETHSLALHWPKGRVYAFEPISQLFNQVKANTERVPNISVYKLALGDRKGQGIMNLSEDPQWGKEWEGGRVSMSSSLYLPKEHLLYSATQFKGQEVVDVTTLDCWAEENGVTRVDMLWLDMQGYELPALKASPNILKTVLVIMIEMEFCEAYVGQPLYKEVRAWLEEQGFVLVAGNFEFPRPPRKWFGDGLFVRAELVN